MSKLSKKVLLYRIFNQIFNKVNESGMRKMGNQLINYNINSQDISEARELTIKSNGKRFRILLEIVTSCFGNCTGCSLSYTDRKNIKPEISIEKIQEILSYFVPIIREKKELITSVVNLGTGDYFMMDEKFLEDLFKSIRIFFDHLHTVRNILTVSTSLFLSEEKMKNRLEIMSRYLHPTQFAIDGVVDPFMLEKHYDRYLNNYKALTKTFPFFDLVLNLSNEITPEHILLMKKFLKELNILSFDIQYALNNGNTYRVKTSQDKIAQVLEAVYKELGEETKQLVELNLAMPDTKEDGQTIFEEMLSHARYIAKERVMVNNRGEIYPIGFGYGDIILDKRYNFNKPIGSIYEPYDEEKAAQQIFEFLKEIFMKNRVCHSCEFSRLCYSTGYSFYNKLNTQHTSCENVGLYIFKKIKNEQQTV